MSVEVFCLQVLWLEVEEVAIGHDGETIARGVIVLQQELRLRLARYPRGTCAIALLTLGLVWTLSMWRFLKHRNREPWKRKPWIGNPIYVFDVLATPIIVVELRYTRRFGSIFPRPFELRTRTMPSSSQKFWSSRKR